MTPVQPGSTELAGMTARVAEFAGSEMFRRLFREGMDLVEETAAYLDGPGREDAKRLGRAGALSYAAESMTLTTQLMQSASWLLTQRAVAEGDMTPEEAAEERYRLNPGARKDAHWPADDEPCPARLADLATRSEALYRRLARLDAELFDGTAEPADPEANPVARQLSALESAFGAQG
ncbi:DUF1465 domain-containing protein [Marinicauda salina]|uniref:DUF1465 domain-containing protein n=1 Tax=Marinicauda salina TaxID=2135793 RepID=A0A2U2BQP5_9PROT|nr:DUF1465 family protein [Marinicauda salina]PWE16325.1 DUF1465 domain-containing protein [Marinicauda salina]